MKLKSAAKSLVKLLVGIVGLFIMALALNAPAEIGELSGLMLVVGFVIMAAAILSSPPDGKRM